MDGEYSLYTIILDYNGGTYIKQVFAKNEVDSFNDWLEGLDYSIIFGFGEASYHKVSLYWSDTRELIPLRGIINVWCLTLPIGTKFFLVNIVKTVQ